ncbi:hypothetical protein ABIE00_002741 [Arthrobacter sp. OAP107]
MCRKKGRQQSANPDAGHYDGTVYVRRLQNRVLRWRRKQRLSLLHRPGNRLAHVRADPPGRPERSPGHRHRSPPGMMSCLTWIPSDCSAVCSIDVYADSPARAVEVPATRSLGLTALEPLTKRMVPHTTPASRQGPAGRLRPVREWKLRQLLQGRQLSLPARGAGTLAAEPGCTAALLIGPSLAAARSRAALSDWRFSTAAAKPCALIPRGRGRARGDQHAPVSAKSRRHRSRHARIASPLRHRVPCLHR